MIFAGEANNIGKRKRSIGVSIYGITYILFSVVFICVVQKMRPVFHSYGFIFEIKKMELFAWFIPAILGIGILRLSNLFRVLAIAISAIFAFWTPVMFLYSKILYIVNDTNMPFLSLSDIPDICVTLFGTSAIYFFTRPEVKKQFK